MAEWHADEQDSHRPDKGYNYYIYNDPKDPGFDIKEVYKLFAQVAGKATADGESAKDKNQLEAVDLPFLLQTFKHDHVYTSVISA